MRIARTPGTRHAMRPTAPSVSAAATSTVGSSAETPYSRAASKRPSAATPATPITLLGRWTYEIFAAHWPNHDGPIANAFNNATKYVVTHSLEHFDWKNSQRIGGDVVNEIRRLKASDRPALHVWGSSVLLQTLIAAELVDEYYILEMTQTHPALILHSRCRRKSTTLRSTRA